MCNIECECEKPQDDTPPAQLITTVVDVEITRHRLKALVKRLEEWEANLAPNDVLYHNIDGLFDEDGELKFFKVRVWTDEELSNEFNLPSPQVKWFLKQTYPNYCYEDRADRQLWQMLDALSRLGYAYQEQKREFAELKDSYDALKGHCASYGKDVKEDPLSVSVLKAQIDHYKTHIDSLERDLSMARAYRFEAVKAAEKDEKLHQEEKKKFHFLLWVSLAVAAATHLIYLF